MVQQKGRRVPQRRIMFADLVQQQDDSSQACLSVVTLVIAGSKLTRLASCQQCRRRPGELT